MLPKTNPSLDCSFIVNNKKKSIDFRIKFYEMTRFLRAITNSYKQNFITQEFIFSLQIRKKLQNFEKVSLKTHFKPMVHSPEIFRKPLVFFTEVGQLAALLAIKLPIV